MYHNCKEDSLNRDMFRPMILHFPRSCCRIKRKVANKMKLKLSAFSSHYNPFTHRLGLTETDQTSPIYISRTFVDLARVAVSACVLRAGQARNEINIVLNYILKRLLFRARSFCLPFACRCP